MDINIKLKIKAILPHTYSIFSLLNISNKFIASAGRDRKIYNIDDTINQNINKIISSSFDKTIKVFNYKENNFNKITKIILTWHSSSICCIKYDPIRKQILTVDINCIINIWEFNKLYKYYTIIKSTKKIIAQITK